MFRLIVLDPDPGIRRRLVRILAHAIPRDKIGEAASLQELTPLIQGRQLIFAEEALPDGHMSDWILDQPKTSWICVTADSTLKQLRRCQKAGVLDYILKPVREERLLEAVKRFKTLDHMKNRISQAEVDQFYLNRQPDPHHLREQIYEAAVDYFTAQQLAERLRVSAVTTRRYLQQLLEDGRLTMFEQHGSRGRPVRYYKQAERKQDHEDHSGNR